jgi:hypothetical protein
MRTRFQPCGPNLPAHTRRPIISEGTRLLPEDAVDVTQGLDLGELGAEILIGSRDTNVGDQVPGTPATLGESFAGRFHGSCSPKNIANFRERIQGGLLRGSRSIFQIVYLLREGV